MAVKLREGVIFGGIWDDLGVIGEKNPWNACNKDLETCGLGNHASPVNKIPRNITANEPQFTGAANVWANFG